MSIEKKFKYAVTAAPWALEGAPVLLCGDLHEQFENAKSMGYDAVELHLRTPEDAKVEEIIQFKNKFDINVSSVATGLSNLVDNLSFIDDDLAVRKSAVERIKAFIDWSAALDSGIILGSLRGSIPDDGLEQDIYTQRLVSCIEEILAYAEPKKVPIFLEVINRYETNYLNTAKETIDFVKGFQSDWLFVHLDTFHMNIEENSFADALEICGDYLGYVHFADNNRHECGSGMIDFKKIFNTLKKINYNGYISIECLPVPDGITAANKSIEYANQMSL